MLLSTQDSRLEKSEYILSIDVVENFTREFQRAQLEETSVVKESC